MIEFELTDEQKMMKDMAHEFAEKEIRPIAAELDEKEEHSWEIVKKAAKSGLITHGIPAEYGGGGQGSITGCIIAEELAWGCLGIATTLGAPTLASLPIIITGNEDQKKEWLSRLCNPDNPKLAGFCLTEPEAGSDAANLKTTAVLDGDEYVINGNKHFITNGGLSEFYTVFAMTDKSKGYGGISAFIVDANSPGIAMARKESKMGIRASQTAEMVFEDVRVPKENLLKEEGMGFYVAMSTLDVSRPGVGSIAVGVARAAYEAALEYAKERIQFGKPIIRHQAIGFMLADMLIQITAARMLVWNAAWQVDQGKPGLESAMAKTFASDVAMWVTTEAVQIHGGYGYMKEYPVEKWMRDAKITQIYEGTNQIQRLIISGTIGSRK